jgi:hypothetical protein
VRFERGSTFAFAAFAAFAAGRFRFLPAIVGT